jgi:hypothetical protein
MVDGVLIPAAECPLIFYSLSLHKFGALMERNEKK